MFNELLLLFISSSYVQSDRVYMPFTQTEGSEATLAQVRARALKPSHAASDGLISGGFFVYFRPIGSSSPPPPAPREASLSP